MIKQFPGLGKTKSTLDPTTILQITHLKRHTSFIE